MNRFFVIVLNLVFLLAGLTGCAKVPGDADAAQPEMAANNSGEQQLPFSANKANGDKPALVPDRLTIPAGTMVTVRLQQSVSSATAQSGERFEAVLDQPLVVNGKTIAGKGAPVTGRVVQAKQSGHLHNSGYLRLALASITVDGKAVAVQSSSVFAQGANHNKRNAALIGGGTGAGALIGALAGGGKGALIGAGAGAAAGTTGAYATGKKDVSFGPERRLTFRLTQPLVTG